MAVRSATNLRICHMSLVVHLVAESLTLLAVATLHSTLSHLVEAFHLQALAHLHTSAAVAVMHRSVRLVHHCAMNRSSMTILVTTCIVTIIVIICETCSCTKHCHYCCHYKSLKSHHNLNFFYSPPSLSSFALRRFHQKELRRLSRWMQRESLILFFICLYSADALPPLGVGGLPFVSTLQSYALPPTIPRCFFLSLRVFLLNDGGIPYTLPLKTIFPQSHRALRDFQVSLARARRLRCFALRSRGHRAIRTAHSQALT